MSVTALAEYADMIFTRAYLELGMRKWWLEMRPDSETQLDPKGYVMLRCDVRTPAGELVAVEHRALMRAIEKNAQISVSVMEEVVEHHVTEFMKRITAAELGTDEEPSTTGVHASEYAAARSWVVSMRVRSLIGARSAAQAISDIGKAESDEVPPPNVQQEFAPGGKYARMDSEDGIHSVMETPADG